MTPRSRPLSLAEFALARSVLRRRDPELLHELRSRQPLDVDAESREAIISALADELCEVGFGADDEINDEGRALEDLIDRFNFHEEPDRVIAFRKAFRHFETRAFPRAGRLDLSDADIDLALEDTYLAGYCSSFLSHGRLPETPVILDSSIDERLKEARVESEADRQVQSSFLSYRAEMRQLAEALNRLLR